MSIWQTTAIKASGIVEDSAVASAIEARAQILADTQATEEAVLRPRETGAWSHAQRAALAARIARLNGEEALSRLYGGEATAPVPAVVEDFMDRVAARPKDIQADDIRRLQEAGIADADIVRLCELNAFLAYQIRLIAGLRLLAEAE